MGHPGYFGLITPSPLPVGALGDLIASALNQNVGTYTIGPSAVAMERYDEGIDISRRLIEGWLAEE